MTGWMAAAVACLAAVGPAQALAAQGVVIAQTVTMTGTPTPSEVQLTQQKMRADIVSIFILPPSIRALKSRLQRRAEDSAATIETRLQNARLELEHWREYDYVVINDDLDRAFTSVKAIVAAERLRRDRRPGLFDFVSGLLEEDPA